MRRLLVLLLCLAPIPVVAVTATASSRSSHNVNARVDGAIYSPGNTALSAFVVKDANLGTGAGRLVINTVNNANVGTAKAYFGDATLKFKLTIVYGTVSGDELPLTGSGSITGGTGRLKGATGKIKFTGSQNIRTNSFTSKVTGTAKY
jgi:hypothetical protein